MQKLYTKDEIKALLQCSDAAVYRGLVAIYCKQTTTEQARHSTVVTNGVGFSSCDAQILSDFAEQVMRWNAQVKENRQHATPLSAKQLTVARKKISKYAAQLAAIANKKAAAMQQTMQQ